MNKTVLIFPGGMPRSLEHLERCLREGHSVVGASSLEFDTAKHRYPQWDFLPYVTSSAFDVALQSVLTRRGVTHIYTQNMVVWNYLHGALQRLAPQVELNPSPLEQELSGYRAAAKEAADLARQPLSLASDWKEAPLMSSLELSSFYRHVDQIPGMCDHNKMRAFVQIFRQAARGDIVEIGSWWGKSALVLTLLARKYQVGKLLCVDPWANEHLMQGDEKGLVDEMSRQVDATEALRVFEMNLLPYSVGDINYLRMTSVEAAKVYASGGQISTPSFGATQYVGQVSILHIDGNHSHAAVQADIAAWSGAVCEGGWIVVDDYRWPFGDGPRLASDAFLTERFGEFGAAFVMGGALFMQRRPS